MEGMKSRKRKYNAKVMCAVNLRGKKRKKFGYISEKLKSSKRKEATFYRQWSAYN